MKSKINIIAEIGVNHNGKFLTAVKLMQKAKKCGADSVKFQTFLQMNFVKKMQKKQIIKSNKHQKNFHITICLKI